ncbi:MAG: electron transfer flavoprotein subunit beta/FixA family protein [Candidatus Micrarchaeaceae archaeon]
MNILVCVKQVPDIESRFKVDTLNKWYDQNDLIYTINEYDNYAAEEAVRLKEKIKGSTLTVLSIGPERVKDVIMKVMAMGADKGIHILNENEYKLDSYQKANIIAEYIKRNNFDIIFTGLQSQDKSSTQVGPMIAEILEINCVTAVTSLEFSDNSKFIVKRELEGGLKAKIKVSIPVVLTCQSGLNIPRYVSLLNIRKAKTKEFLTFKTEDFLEEKRLIDTTNVFKPEKISNGVVLEGKSDEIADKLISILKEKTQVLK